MNSETTNEPLPTMRTRSGGGRAFHSRLEPFLDFIREQRQRRRTWKEIAELLGSEKDCVISTQGLHQFCKRHARRQNQPHWERELSGDLPAGSTGSTNSQSRRIVTASVPDERAFRRPNPNHIQLNDPTKL
jgi:hypothetical protein